MAKIEHCAVLAAVAWSGVAAAQDVPASTPQAPPGEERKGFIVGFSLGGGFAQSSIEAADDFGGFAFQFHLGGMITHRAALVMDVSSLRRTVFSDRAVAIQSTLFAGQIWPLEQLWVKAGVGLAFLSYIDQWDDYVVDEGVGASIGVAVGYEIFQMRSMVIDLQARWTGSFYDNLTVNGISLLAGISWY